MKSFKKSVHMSVLVLSYTWLACLFGTASMGVCQELEYPRLKTPNCRLAFGWHAMIKANALPSPCVLDVAPVLDRELGVIAGSLTLPLYRASEMLRIKEGTLLVCGFDYTNPQAQTGGRGVICTVSADFSQATPILSLVSTQYYDDLDPYGIWANVGNSHRIVMQDYNSGCLLAATLHPGWGVVSTDIPPRQDWSVIATPASIPALTDPWRCLIFKSGQNLVIVEDGSDDKTQLAEVAGSWLASSMGTNPILGFDIGARGYGFNSASPVRWYSADISDVLLADQAGNTLYAFSGSQTGWLTGSANSVLGAHVGDTITLRHVNSGAERDFVPTLYYDGNTSSGAVNVGATYMPHQVLLRGWPMLGVGCGVDLPAANVEAGLLIAFRTSSDPVTITAGKAVLSPALADFFQIPAGAVRQAVGRIVPIPNDPNLDGLVVLFQFVFQEAGQPLVYSDVFGSKVRPTADLIPSTAAVASAQSLYTGQPSSATPSPNNVSMQQWRAALMQSGWRNLSVSERASIANGSASLAALRAN